MKLPTFFQKHRPRPRLRVVPPMYLLLFVGVVFAMLFSSCSDWGCNSDWGGAQDTAFTMHLVDATTGEQLLGLYTPYEGGYASIYVTDEEGEEVRRGRKNDNLSWPPLSYTKEVILNEQFSRRFFLHLEERDVDTIDFNMIVIVDKCEKYNFSFVEIFYNDSLYFSGEKMVSRVFSKKR